MGGQFLEGDDHGSLQQRGHVVAQGLEADPGSQPAQTLL